MSSNIDKFLETWKLLETNMREEGLEVREWEEQHIGEVRAEQLKVLRILRNYITHNPTEDFINKIDPLMIKWMKNYIKSMKKNRKNKKTKIVKKTNTTKKTYTTRKNNSKTKNAKTKQTINIKPKQKIEKKVIKSKKRNTLPKKKKMNKK